jgi:hypothetical protein
MIVLQSRASALDKVGGSTFQNGELELSLGWGERTREPFFNSSHTHVLNVLIVISVPFALSVFAPWRENISSLVPSCLLPRRSPAKAGGGKNLFRPESPHPKSTLSHPKSTVELGYKPLNWGENALRTRQIVCSGRSKPLEIPGHFRGQT